MLIFLYSPNTPKNETKTTTLTGISLLYDVLEYTAPVFFRDLCYLFFICFWCYLVAASNPANDVSFFMPKGSWYLTMCLCRRFPPFSVLVASNSSTLCVIYPNQNTLKIGLIHIWDKCQFLPHPTLLLYDYLNWHLQCFFLYDPVSSLKMPWRPCEVYDFAPAFEGETLTLGRNSRSFSAVLASAV